MNKNIVILVMIISLVFAMTACVKNTENDVKTGSEEQNNREEVEKKDEGVQTNQKTEKEESKDDTIKKEENNKNDASDKVANEEDIDYEHERIGFSQSGSGLIAGDGKGNLYFRSELDNWHLYKSKFDGSEKTKLCDDVADEINVLDDYVYYTSYRDNFNVYRIKTDGTSREKLVDSYCANLRVTENYMYMCLRDEKNASHIYRANLDGSNLELLVSNMDLGTYHKGVLYLTDNESLYSYNLKTGERIMLLKKYTHYISADDEGVYFWLPNQGQYCKIDNEGKMTVLQRGGNFYAKEKNRLYFVGYSKDGMNSECIYYKDLKTEKEVMIYQFSDEYYDRYGHSIGLTKQDIRKGNVDEKFLNEDNEIEGLSDSPSMIYVVDGVAFTRATFKENIENRSTWECLLKVFDDGRYEIFD